MPSELGFIASSYYLKNSTVKKFNDENPYNLGKADLFNSTEQINQNEKAISLLKENSGLSFINPTLFLSSDYGQGLREFLSQYKVSRIV